MIPLVFVTESSGKLQEVQRILGTQLEHHSVHLPEIQAVEVEPVVKFKVEKAYEMLRRPVMVEDTGLFIKAWNDFPGALIKWFVRYVGDTGICKMMKDCPNRRATAQTVVAISEGGTEPLIFVGVARGRIPFRPAGTGGFGWDKIFIPDGASRTFGQMTPEEKDRYSMRRQAFEAVIAHYS